MENEKKVVNLAEEQLGQVAGGSLVEDIGNMGEGGQSNKNNNNNNKLPTADDPHNNPTVNPKIPNNNGLPDISLPKDIGDM